MVYLCISSSLLNRFIEKTSHKEPGKNKIMIRCIRGCDCTYVWGSSGWKDDFNDLLYDDSCVI